MGTVVISLNRIICHNTTEAGHDEVYYDSPAVTRTDAAGRTKHDDRLSPGPRPEQLGNADGLNGDPNTAWDCNDDKDGGQYDQTLDVQLFSVRVDPRASA